MTCPHQSRIRDRGPFTCALGRYGGKPYLGNCLECMEAGNNRRGVGDIVEKLSKPIAKALKLSCLDKQGQLKPESPCAKRRDRLNKIKL